MRGLICDDHPLMREALAATMRDRWPGVTIDEAGDYPQAWAAAEAGPDFCLLDLDMPGAEPVEGLRALRAKAPGAVVLVVTGLSDQSLLAEVAGCGVTAVLSKNTDAAVLLAAIREGIPQLQDHEARTLPPRQQEVLGGLSRGLTNKEIAIELGISPATVKIHVARLISWLGAANRTDAVARAQRGRVI
jgi:DNA-binding NarL/FixJ family response regulator